MREFKASIFQALAHPTRIAMVECLRQGEATVSMLCEKVELEQANASQHLAVLRAKFIVDKRKEGNQVYYRLRDPLLGEMMDKMRDYFLAHMNDAIRVLQIEKKTSKKSSTETKS